MLLIVGYKVTTKKRMSVKNSRINPIKKEENCRSSLYRIAYLFPKISGRNEKKNYIKADVINVFS
jgi:hypothetical protein